MSAAKIAGSEAPKCAYSPIKVSSHSQFFYASNADGSLALLRQRNPEAFKQLYVAYSASLFGIITQIVASKEVSEDLLQKVFMKIWASIDLYNPEKERLFTWMYRIARNSAVDCRECGDLVKTIKNANIVPLFPITGDKLTVRYNFDRLDISLLLSDLSPNQHEVLNLVCFDGYTLTEVSEKLQIPPETVKFKIRLAFKILRG